MTRRAFQLYGGFDIGQMRASKKAQRISFYMLSALQRAVRFEVNNELFTPEETFPTSQLSAYVYRVLVCVKRLINKQLICKIESSKPSLSDYVLKIKDVLEFQCR